LRKAFVYQGFRLVDTIQVRTRDGKGAEASSAVQMGEASSQMAMYHISCIPALTTDEKGTLIRLDSLRFGAKIPVSTGANSWNYVDTGITQNVDVRDGQKAVVGRANINGKDGAVFLVVTATVVE
jgi:hypothetical protein